LQAIQFQKGCSLLYQVIQNSGMRGNDTFSSYQNLMQLSPKELQGRLGPGDALIEFYIYEIVQDTAAIVTVENESLSLMEIPIPWTRPAYSGEEDADVHIILSAHNPMTPRSNAVSRRLSDLVIHPWAQKIQDAVRIILSPHNYLHNLPLHFELLKEPEQRIVQYLPLGTMVRTFSHPIKKDALQKCLFVGYAPKGDIDINRDLAILRSHVPNVFVLQNESATIENVIEKIHDSDLVYFACHGLFSRERLAAYLQVYDGQLSAGHILSSQGARAPKLVILNACYTGTAGRIYAQGDQMLSLHTAFLMKGVSYVLASLWTIGDRCAIKLAEYFLSSIFHKNLDVEHSYKDAVANISREGIWADPLEWAPFVLFGPSSIPE